MYLYLVIDRLINVYPSCMDQNLILPDMEWRSSFALFLSKHSQDLHNSTLIKAITRKIIPNILELFIEHVQTLTSRDSIKKEKSQVILVNMFYFPSHLHFQSTK